VSGRNSTPPFLPRDIKRIFPPFPPVPHPPPPPFPSSPLSVEPSVSGSLPTLERPQRNMPPPTGHPELLSDYFLRASEMSYRPSPWDSTMISLFPLRLLCDFPFFSKGCRSPFSPFPPPSFPRTITMKAFSLSCIGAWTSQFIAILASRKVVFGGVWR